MNEKKSKISAQTASLIACVTVIAAAGLLAVLLAMSLLGLLHPRGIRITLYTPNAAYVYDDTEHIGNEPKITAGALAQGHSLQVTGLPRGTLVGSYENKPQFVITDETGADVTKLYHITGQYGTMQILPRHISLHCDGQEKLYDGEPLSCGEAKVINPDSLPEGHTLQQAGGNSITMPGSARCAPDYRIVNAAGADVTGQYEIQERFGDLVIQPIRLYFETESAQKQYDGEPPTCDSWKPTGGILLAGHTLDVTVTGTLTEAGTARNTMDVMIIDETGKDVSAIYDVEVNAGILTVSPRAIKLRTESVTAIYDGAPVQGSRWEMVSGRLMSGDRVEASSIASLAQPGTIENTMRFTVVDEKGLDVTGRYQISVDTGTLTMQPRPITIRTGSATEVFCEQVLQCNDYTVIAGSLAEGDSMIMTGCFLFEVGSCDNAPLELLVLQNDRIDVTACYRISYEYGRLELTSG